MIDPLTSSFAFSELWGLSKSVLQKLKSIKNAPKELRILQDEIERFNSHIDDVKDVVSQLNHDDRCSRRIDEAATHCMDVLEPIDGLLRSYSTERCSVGKRFVLRTKAGFRLEGLKSKVAALEKPQRDLELALSTAMVQITARNASVTFHSILVL